jgi:hypothetical protein
VLAFLALDSFRTGASTNSLPLYPLIFAAVPLLDAALAVLRRLRNDGSPLLGDRGHFYDLLLARGLSQRKVALACYSITAVLVAAGWFSVRVGFAEAIIISAICSGALLAVALRFGALRSSEVVLGVQEAKTVEFSRNVLPSVERTKLRRR